jgi:Ca2+-binding RTX toxin-like protein
VSTTFTAAYTPTIVGSTGNDTLLGTAGNDVIDGGAGNDQILGQGGWDIFIGGAGNDVLRGSGIAVLSGSQANWIIQGSAAGYYTATHRTTGEVDTMYGISMVQFDTGAAIAIDVLAGTGTSGDDRLIGSPGNDTLDGGAGNDTLIAFDQNDTLIGGAGDDQLDGGNGIDTAVLSGTRAEWSFTPAAPLTSTEWTVGRAVYATNMITGETDRMVSIESVRFSDQTASLLDLVKTTVTSGDDVIHGTINSDVLDGGAGNDTIYGYNNDDTLIGGVGNDLLNGGASNDLLIGGAGNDTLDGDAASDTVVLSGTRSDWTFRGNADSSVTATNRITGETDKLINIEFVRVGSAAAVAIQDILTPGGPGNDILYGTAYNDMLQGGDGDDQLFGLYGNDVLIGGAGNDVLDGTGFNFIPPPGTDTAVLSGTAADWTFMFLGGTGDFREFSATNKLTGERDLLRSIELVRFGSGPDVAIDSLLNPTSPSTPITITARGHTGSEQMQLIVKGQVVATFDNVPVGGRTYTYNAPEAVTANDIRIAFTNDVWQPGLDRNLVVDKITVGGRVFETEAPSVYSTGVWLPQDGIVAGYGRGETLASNGYFQYAETTTNPTQTAITITASGHTGQEQMQLIIKGQVVATYDNVPVGGRTYTYDAAGGVTASDIRIAFTNDAWAPGADRNLVVDKITVGGRVFETEAASVYSTGTWRPEDGIVAGYGRGDTLASNGYFQYADSSTNPAPTTIKITASGQTGSEQMQLIVKGQVVATFDNVGQTAAVYSYQASTTITANDVRVAFTNDAWQPGFDRNLTVDKIDLNGQVFQTEAANVYSTGVWLPQDGVVAGYGRGETLASNGYFQYSTGTTNTSSALDATLVAA